MDRVTAQRIVAAYLTTQDLTHALRYGAPLSLLPFSKAEIKSALKVLLDGTVDSQVRMQYMSCFVQLSKFVPDEQARLGIAVQAALDAEDAEWLAELEPIGRTTEAIHLERVRLHRELTEFLEQDEQAVRWS